MKKHKDKTPLTINNNHNILNKSLLNREAKAFTKTSGCSVKVLAISRKWQFLFENFYGKKYNVSYRERTLLKKIADENLEADILSAMVAMFLSYLTDDWFKERNMIPNLGTFCKKFDFWKTRGYAVLPKMNGLNGSNWWIVNEAGISLNGHEYPDILKLEKKEGVVIAYRVREGNLVKTIFKS